MYIGGIKRILSDKFGDRVVQDVELTTLMDWVHYHDVLGHFILRHWHTALACTIKIPATFWTMVSLPQLIASRQGSDAR
jgi:hypothetical protein